MNPVLAQVYGLDKTASEEEGQATLDTISAAELLAAHQAGQVDINDFLVSEEPEKTAGFDLSQYSEEELQQALGELEETQKLASSEEQYWDAAGRQMARSYADELTKQASTELPMDLNELSAEEIIGLAYELTDEMDKTAAYDEDEIDLNAFTPEEIIELAYHLENSESEKVAGAYDLNEFSVDEFIDFAADLEDEMEKEAGIRDWAARQGHAAKAQGLKAWQYAKGKGQGAHKGVKGHYSRRWERGGKRGEGMVMKHLQKRRGKGKAYSEAALRRIQKGQRGLGRAVEFAPEAAVVGGTGYGAHKWQKNRKRGR
jgi:hypothetical protein